MCLRILSPSVPLTESVTNGCSRGHQPSCRQPGSALQPGSCSDTAHAHTSAGRKAEEQDLPEQIDGTLCWLSHLCHLYKLVQQRCAKEDDWQLSCYHCTQNQARKEQNHWSALETHTQNQNPPLTTMLSVQGTLASADCQSQRAPFASWTPFPVDEFLSNMQHPVGRENATE